MRSTPHIERYTAPTLILHAADGRTAVVPGFQPFEAADVAVMNLEPRLERLPPPDLTELLRRHPGGLTSEEVARTLADTTVSPDRFAAEAALIRLAADGGAVGVALGDDALWTFNSHRGTQ
jgi:hypothetical protein